MNEHSKVRLPYTLEATHPFNGTFTRMPELDKPPRQYDARHDGAATLPAYAYTRGRVTLYFTPVYGYNNIQL